MRPDCFAKPSMAVTRVSALSILAALLALTGCDKPSAKQPAPRPNIVFILIDTLRADRLGCYGAADAQTPRIDAIAKEGVVFERVISPAPWTLPAMGSIFTGVYPSVHKANDYSQGGDMLRTEVRVVGDDWDTLAERLQGAGYATAAFSANPFIQPATGFAQGFDHFDGSFASNAAPGKLVTAAAMKWLDSRADKSKPVFLYLHYMDVHAPYILPDDILNPLLAKLGKEKDMRPIEQIEATNHPGFFGTSAPYRGEPHNTLRRYAEYYDALYDGCVQLMDREIGALQTSLSERKLWDDSYVIITADHGEALGEHLVWTHGFTAHQNQIHIPLIMRWPGTLAEKRVTGVARGFDIGPTILKQLDLPMLERAQGRPLVGAFEEAEFKNRIAYSEGVKRHEKMNEISAPLRELFNIADDPDEQTDLSAQYPERVAELERLLYAQIQQNRDMAEGVAVGSATMNTAPITAGGYSGGDDDEPDFDIPECALIDYPWKLLYSITPQTVAKQRQAKKQAATPTAAP